MRGIPGRTECCASAAHFQGFVSAVQIGRHDISDSSEAFESFTIVEEIPHPNFNSQTVDYDFMMIKISGNSAYSPVELDDGGENLLADGTDLIVVGWGRTSTDGQISNVLLEAEVDSDSSCGFWSSSWISSRMFCAGRPGKDSCRGGSGGPIIHKNTGKQVGVVSWGSTVCEDSNFPGIYAKVSDQLPWIQTYINAWNLCDWRCYLDRYPDLQNSFGADQALAEQHYINNGHLESRDCTCDPSDPLQQVCDWRCYLDNYQDLRNAFGGNEKIAAQHYTSNGLGEGRDCTCNCNWVCYLDRYQDLKSAFGNNQATAAQHWRNEGQSEARDCTCNFNDPVQQVCDWGCYLDRYHDLVDAFGNNQVAAEQHWISHGQSKGRDCTCNS